ncbi:MULTISPECIES: hypothetical protein [Catenuloplanes]|uniref:Uncharacterized protein n=1 Tax=Catenuloplanes niger TaxID=587534 RepID=A0AAE4CVT6_9ACTN|nr:hypothetical protein [Catenuloplanes niger]MDR7325782.1 hypothetical protein [Catenuloplanes niger]
MARDSGSGPPNGASDIVTVELSAAEAASGTTKTIALPPDGRLIAINLPAGIGDGAILRLPRNDATSTDGPPELTIHITVTSGDSADEPTSVIPLPTPYDETTPIAVPGDDEKTTVLPAGQDRTAVIPAPDSDADERTTVFATTPPAPADEDRTTVISTGTPPAPATTPSPASDSTSAPASDSTSAPDGDRTAVIPAGTPSSTDDRTAAIPAGNPAPGETPSSAADDDRTAAIPAAGVALPAAAGETPASGSDDDRTDVIPAGGTPAGAGADPATATPAGSAAETAPAAADEDRTTVIPTGAATGGNPATGADDDRTDTIPAGATPAGPADASPAATTAADEDRTTAIPVPGAAETKASDADRTDPGVVPGVVAAGAAGAAGAAAAASARSGDTGAQPATPPFNAETTQHVPSDATPAPAAADATPPGYTMPEGTASESAGVPPTSGAPSTAYPPTPGPGYQPAPGAASQSYPPAPGTPVSGVPAGGYPPVSGAPSPAYPPAPGTPGYPPVSGGPSPAYPPAPGTPGYPPVSGAPAGGYPPVSGAPGYPPVSGAPGQPASGAPGYPPVPGTPGYPNAAGTPGYPPPGTPGYPVSGAGAAGYPTSGVPASGAPGWGQPPQSGGAPAWGQPGAYPLGAPGGFAAPPQQKPKRSTGLIVGAAVLVVLLCAGAVAVPWVLNSGEPDPDPTGDGGGAAPATSQAAVAMTTAQYQAMLSALDADVQPAWDAMNRTTKPDALSSAADDLGEMLGLQADELARVTPPEEVADEHTLLVDALNALSTDVLDTSLSAEGSALCTGSSAVNLVSRSDGGADLRDAATALSAADLKVGGWMPKALKEENRRPPNGNYYRRIQGGLGELKVENGGDHDALINLVKNGQTRPEVSFYVQAKGNFTASSIHDGAYTIYVTSGSDFDGTRFNRDCDFSKFDEAITYETTNSQYTIWEISLEATAGGNASTSDVPPGAFPE